MKKLLVILALAILLVPGILLAQPPGCNWGGDPSLRYGFNQLTWIDSGTPVVKTSGYHQPGPDTVTANPGELVKQIIGCYNSAASWVPSCAGPADTFCCFLTAPVGWTKTGNPALGSAVILPGAGYLWYQRLYITVPCTATPGTYQVIAKNAYHNAGACAPECGDCNDPNLRPGDGLNYYNSDTLYIKVVNPPAIIPLSILQDSLTLVDQGQTQAYVPFSICNADACFPAFNYNIKSKGHFGPAINTSGSVSVPGGDCVDVYGVINAGTPVVICDYDTLTIIAWGGRPAWFMYDTCVQIVHAVSAEPVPLFTVPVVTILVLALILAAAVFMRRRAVSKA